LVVFISINNYGQTATDTTNLHYSIKPQSTRPYDPKTPSSNLNLKDPSNITTEVEYNQKTNEYTIHKKAGSVDFTPPYTMSFEEYKNYDINKSLKEYWRQRYQNETFEKQNSLLPQLNVGNEVFETIFGSSTIEIKPQGSASLRFGLKISDNKNPNIAEDLQRQTSFDFKEEIQMNVTGKIGDNLEMKVSYNTESQFEFDNTMNLRYQGKEDDILQKVEAGNVSLPLSTSLISGSQSLFGVLTEMKFGKLYVSSVASQQKGETKTITTEGGAQKSDFDISASEYDKNRHFFLSHYFRKNFDEALSTLPVVQTPISITKIEVWVTNDKQSTENGRNILAFMDLGEEKEKYNLYEEGETEKGTITGHTFTGSESPTNDANKLYDSIVTLPGIRDINNATKLLSKAGYIGGKQYEKVEYARKLSTSEYTLNSSLGFISLNTALNADEILAVAFEYTINGQIYKVGEFSSDASEGNQTLIVKLIRGTNFSPKYPNWDLMMKNIYSLGAYQVNSDNFILEVQYYNDKTRVYKITDPLLDKTIQDTKLLTLMNLDNLNSSGNYVVGGDGVFDFVNGLTINASSGRIMFPVVEPFGGHLSKTFNNEQATKKYAYQELYDSTQYKAQQVTAKNKFYLKGSYKSAAGSEILLNSLNIPEGSVKVTAGGNPLVENVDYTVDYNMGRVKIINEAYLVSGTPIKVTLESNSMFSVQSKTLVGTHLDYRFNDDFNLGATVMHLSEKPMTQKVSIGEEPISNTIWGLNGSYKTDAPFLTKAVDFLPFLETKEKSSITFEGEYAQLIPGHNKAIGKDGNVYIDDFEGSESSYDLTSREGWVLSSIPQHQLNNFRYSDRYNDLHSGYGRAKLAWYKIDPLFFRSGSPVSADMQSNLQVYRVKEKEIYPNRDQKNGIDVEISTLDLAYNPKERGPYNYNPDLNEDGTLKDSTANWAGIMRELTTNDFESANIEYLEFWMMDPFVEGDSTNTGGQLIFNFGNISEDILKDSRKSYEHGLPTDNPPTGFDTTAWGRVPAIQKSATSFVNDAAQRKLQDVGLDGLSDENERTFFSTYLNSIIGKLSTEAYQKIQSDPSGDDYKYFKESAYDAASADIITRHMDYNGHEGNSPYQSGSSTTYGSSQPDVEDINEDYTLSENESYFQYRVNLKKSGMEVGQNFITDEREVTVTFENKKKKNVKWYQFRIPLNSSTREKYGDIEDFKSIRFMRMLMHGWSSSVVLRFAELDLVRSEWRKYDYVIKDGEESLLPDDEGNDKSASAFNLSTVNIEESGSRKPINYVLPPGVDRQQDPSQQQLTLLNEQSMALRVDSLADGYAKAVYKNINMDMRSYKKLKMYIHAEARGEEDDLQDNELTCFIRLGSDYTANFYEFEVPLVVSPWYSDKRDTVWPSRNNMEIVFDDLLAAKQERNSLIRSGAENVSLTIPYSEAITVNGQIRKITVMGNPNLGTVNTILIGIRNPKAKGNIYNSKDDELEVESAEVWVNELRLCDFDEEGGWAATGRMTMRLADFGNVSVAGSTTSAGFGSIEQTGQERAKEQTNQVDVAVNMDLGKFFPKETNVRVPMFVGYSRTAINPEYDPLDEDIPLSVTMKDMTAAEKKEYKDLVQDLTTRTSVNFTNVGIGSSGKGKPTFYSPSNISVTYAYSKLHHQDISIVKDDEYNYNGSINYVFNNQPKVVEPFKKVKFLKKPYMRLIGDFNFYYAPSQVSYITSMDRKYNENLLRNTENLKSGSTSETYETTFDKSFDWDRQFSLKYSLTKGLKFDYSINTTALIDEDGLYDNTNHNEYESFKNKVWHSIREGGVAQDHNQKFAATYTIPINKIPLFDWVQSTARYNSTYNWEKGAIVKDSSDVGNTIKNTQQISLNLQMNMENLYGKVNFLKEISNKYKQDKKKRNAPKLEDVEYKKEEIKLKADQAKTISHRLNTEEEISVTVTTGNGKAVESTFEIINENKVEVKVKQDIDGGIVTVKGKREVTTSPLQLIAEGTALTLMGFKQLSATYTLNGGSALGGFTEDYDFMNLGENPGWGFVFGGQDENFALRMGQKGKLISNGKLITPFAMTSSRQVDLKATYQPVKDLKIDFTGKHSVTENVSEKYYPYINQNNSNIIDSVVSSDRKVSGTYNLNVCTISTAFEKRVTQKNQHSDSYEKFKSNLVSIAWRLAEKRRGKAPDSYGTGTYDPQYLPQFPDSMPQGYSIGNPDVAIPAFLAAYTGQSSKSVPLSLFNLFYFRPGWKLKYDGLTNIELIGKYFKNISLSHSYNSTFTIGGYTSNSLYDFSQAEDVRYGNMSWATSDVSKGMFIPKYDVGQFAINEQFVPMFGIDMTWKNNVLTKFEYKKARTITTSLVNNQLVEVYNYEYVIGSGYRIEKLELPIKMRNQEQKPVSDLNLRADLSIRDQITILRYLNKDLEPEVTAGSMAFALNISADYQLSEKLTIRLYYDQNITNPKMTGVFRTSDTSFGFQFKFSLAEL
jgi:cell surface protein SprA